MQEVHIKFSELVGKGEGFEFEDGELVGEEEGFEFVDVENVAYTIGEAELALNWLGFRVERGAVQIKENKLDWYELDDPILSFIHPKNIGLTPIDWVHRSQEILKVATEILEPLRDRTATPEEAIDKLVSDGMDPDLMALGTQYYQALMSGLHGADDTCFDYHGTFVDLILEAVETLLKERGGE